MTRYLVTAALVTARVDSPLGTVYGYRGGILPPETTQASIDHLLSLGMIRPLDDLEDPR